MDVFDQGTIIHGLRSDKYPNNRCYGIVISASCDVYNCKVTKLYYLTALDVKDWLVSDVGFDEVFSNVLKNVEDQVSRLVTDNGMDWTALRTFSVDDAGLVIETECKGKKKRQVLDAYSKYQQYLERSSTVEGKLKIAKDEMKSTIDYLDKLCKGEILHFYFLPQAAYLEKGKKDKGLIVDLQEIEYISLEDAEIIEKSGIDYQQLPEDDDIRERLIEKYWLNSPDDYVVLYNNISSPWREHLMQSFSHGFIRIGIDRATKDDFRSIASF